MIYLDVENTERAARFYDHAFGSKAGKEFGTVLNIPGSMQRIVLRQADRARQLSRFTLTLPDIDAAMDRVEAAGGKITQPVFTAADNNRPGVCLSWITNPDGNAIELIQPPRQPR